MRYRPWVFVHSPCASPLARPCGCHRLLPKAVWHATDAVSSIARSGHRTAGASIALPQWRRRDQALPPVWHQPLKPQQERGPRRQRLRNGAHCRPPGRPRAPRSTRASRSDLKCRRQRARGRRSHCEPLEDFNDRYQSKLTIGIELNGGHGTSDKGIRLSKSGAQLIGLTT